MYLIVCKNIAKNLREQFGHAEHEQIVAMDCEFSVSVYGLL
jgi:hypothetical protein